MWRDLEEVDVIAQMWIDEKNRERIQATEQQACEESPADTITEVSFFQP